MSEVTGVRRVVRQFLKLNTWGSDIMRLKKRVSLMVRWQGYADDTFDELMEVIENQAVLLDALRNAVSRLENDLSLLEDAVLDGTSAGPVETDPDLIWTEQDLTYPDDDSLA